MVEKVARAIYESWYHQVEGFSGDPYFGSKKNLWKNWIPAAKAVLKAMHNPTDEVKAAGFKAGEHELWSEPGYHEGETLTYLNDEAPEIIWQAMITAALEGGHEET